MPDFDPATLAALSSLSSGGSSLLSGGTPGADLANFQRTIAANDPYMTAAAPVLNAKFNTSTWTPNQQIATTLGQAALGSILKVLGQRDEGDQLTKVANILPQLYKDPTSVALPDGVDPGAFAALRIGALGRQSTLQDLMTRTLGDKGITIRPDGSIDTSVRDAMNNSDALKKPKMDLSGASPEFQQAMKDSGNDTATARQLLKSRLASEGTLGTLSNSLSVINELERLKKMPQTSSSAYLPDFVEGAVNDVAAKVDPGSNSATYNSAVIPTSESLVRALNQVGKGSQYNLKSVTDDLSEAFGKGPDALAARIRNYQNDVLDGARQKASDLVTNGHIGANPILDQINNLDLDNLGPTTPQTKTIGGQTYQKVPGGWQVVSASSDGASGDW